MAMDSFDQSPLLLPRRLRDGFDRIAAAMRVDQWSAANAEGLNPTQAQVLAFLARRDETGLRVKEIATHLGVSQPSATDTIGALERKGLVVKGADAGDARAVAVRVNKEGLSTLNAIGLASSAMDVALARLSVSEQADLLMLQIKLIRLLQQAGAIPAQRMCVTCRYFQPYAHSDALNPHHCAFVNAAFGDRNLRLDCREHEPAEPSVQTANWWTFSKEGAATPQENP